MSLDDGAGSAWPPGYLHLLAAVGRHQVSGPLPYVHTALLESGNLGEQLAVALLLRRHPPVA